MKAPDSQIAVTLYNLREFCKTESDLDRTLDKVCAIGYQAVQVSGVQLPVDVIKKQLDRHNLFCCATHENLATLTAGDLSGLIDKMKTLECDFTALGSPGVTYTNSYNMTCELADKMMVSGEKLLENGIRLGYHNHAHEFKKFAENNKTMLETFYTRTAVDGIPKVYAAIDVHWVTRGGGSPVRWIWNVNGRMPVVHFKDLVIWEGEPRICEVGEGNLDWPAIIKACQETNVRWYSIEQDNEWPGRDIFESIKISFNNLRAMGVR
jgi:sugar phosphate isomerase/epimerase